jgi:hypothetical protein
MTAYDDVTPRSMELLLPVRMWTLLGRAARESQVDEADYTACCLLAGLAIQYHRNGETLVAQEIATYALFRIEAVGGRAAVVNVDEAADITAMHLEDQMGRERQP